MNVEELYQEFCQNCIYNLGRIGDSVNCDYDGTDVYLRFECCTVRQPNKEIENQTIN